MLSNAVFIFCISAFAFLTWSYCCLTLYSRMFLGRGSWPCESFRGRLRMIYLCYGLKFVMNLLLLKTINWGGLDVLLWWSSGLKILWLRDLNLRLGRVFFKGLDLIGSWFSSIERAGFWWGRWNMQKYQIFFLFIINLNQI